MYQLGSITLYDDDVASLLGTIDNDKWITDAIIDFQYKALSRSESNSRFDFIKTSTSQIIANIVNSPQGDPILPPLAAEKEILCIPLNNAGITDKANAGSHWS